MSDKAHWFVKLRRDAVYLKTDNGILFRTASNDFRLKGASIYNSFTTLLPHLDGTVSAEALVAAVQPEQQEKTLTLLDMLIERGVVRRVDPDDAALLDPKLRQRYRSQVDFIGHFAHDPSRRFSRFRDARIAIIGHGTAFTAAGLALIDNGLSRLVIASHDQQTLYDTTWIARCRRLVEAGAPAQVDTCSPEEIDAAQFDLILCCGESLDGRLLESLQHLTMADACAVLPAFALSGHSYIGPLSAPQQAGCWLCAMMRWSDRTAPASATEFWRKLALSGGALLSNPNLAGTTAQMLGNGVAMEAYRFFTGVPAAEARRHVLDQDLDTLETSRHQFSRHPDCPRCAHLPIDDQAPSARDEPEMLARWYPLLGHPFATFDAFSDAGLEHLPLSISLLAVEGVRVAGWSTASVLQARSKALQEAVRNRVESGECPPLSSFALVKGAITEDWEGTIPPSHVIGWRGMTRDREQAVSVLAGRYVDGGKGVRVPAAAVCPSLDRAQDFDVGRCGLGVGLSYDEAVTRSIRDLFESETIDLIADGQLSFSRFDPSCAIVDTTINYLLTSIALLKADSPVIAVVQLDSGMMAAVLYPEVQPILMDELSVACDLRLETAVRRLLARRVAMLQLQQQDVAIAARHRLAAFAQVPVTLPEAKTLPLYVADQALGADNIHERLADAGRAIVAVEVTPVDVLETHSLRTVKTLFVSREDSSTNTAA